MKKWICRSCGYLFIDTDPMQCPHCGSEDVRPVRPDHG